MTEAPLSIVLAAGGTGGHLFPAAAVGAELTARGHAVSIVTDDRGMQFARIFGALPVKVVAAGRLTDGGFSAKLFGAGRLMRGYVQAQKHLESLKPSAVVGFGGYATWPVLAAAATLKIPTAAHEQNAVLGRVNRWLSPVVDALALSYERTRFLTGSRARKAIVTGNPVRPEVAALAAMPYPAVSEDGIFRILVVGGSLGARVLSEVVPTALSMLPFAQRRRLQVTQQCRAEDLERVDALYREAGIAAETAEFLDDMPERLSWAHLVIARAGASTLAEVAAAGRPAILVPLPIATDDHQTENARSFAQAGAGWLVPQPEFTAADLAKRVQKLITRPEGLIEAAAAARTLGRPEATRLLSDLIERMARLKGTGRDLFAEPALAPTTLDDKTMQRRAA